MPTWLGIIVAGVASFELTRRAVAHVTRRRALADTNYRGLLLPKAGFAPVLGIAGALALVAYLDRAIFDAPALGAASLVALTAVALAAIGLYDDLADDARLRDIAVGVVAALVALAAGGLSRAIPAALVVGLSALALDRFDTVPGRAGKIGLLWSAALVIGASIGGAVALPVILAIAVAIAVWLPLDLRERAMLGNAGSLGLGGALGIITVSDVSVSVELGLAVLLAGVVLAGPRLGEAIGRVGPLTKLDELGRVVPEVPPGVLL